MDTYRVTLTHEDLDGPFVADTIAPSASAAASRIRATAFHAYRHAPLLSADVDVVWLHEGPPRDKQWRIKALPSGLLTDGTVIPQSRLLEDKGTDKRARNITLLFDPSVGS